MGNELSKGNGHNSNRMAIAAMSNVMKLRSEDMKSLKSKCLANTSEVSGGIARKDFRIAMAEIDVDETDAEILDRLFTMFDMTGEDCIHALHFLVGASPLAVLGRANEKLRFAFELLDINQTGSVDRSDFEALLGSINATASYFGDPVLSREQINGLADDILQSSNSFEYRDNIDAILSHHFVQQFITGAGSCRYGTGDS